MYARNLALLRVARNRGVNFKPGQPPQEPEPVGRRSARPGRRLTRRNFRRLRFYPAFWERALPVQCVKYTFLFLANFTPIKNPPFSALGRSGL